MDELLSPDPSPHASQGLAWAHVTLRRGKEVSPDCVTEWQHLVYALAEVQRTEICECATVVRVGHPSPGQLSRDVLKFVDRLVQFTKSQPPTLVYRVK